MDRIIYTTMTGANAGCPPAGGAVATTWPMLSTQGFRARCPPFRSVPLQRLGSTTRVFALEATSGHFEVSGPVKRTGRNLDAMAVGNAWFAVQGSMAPEAYTRNGAL